MLSLLLLVLVTSSAAHHGPHHTSSGEGEVPDEVHVDEPLPNLGEPSPLDGVDLTGNGPVEYDINIAEYGLPKEEESKKGVVGDDESSDNQKGEDETTRDEGRKRFPFGSGFVFESPLITHFTRYFKQLEDAMDRAFRRNVNHLVDSKNGSTISESTEEEVDDSGNKFVVHKTVVKSEDGDTNSSVVVKVLDNRAKRSNWMSEPIQ